MAILGVPFDGNFASPYRASAAGEDFTKTVWGSVIPRSQGLRAITGVPIWASAPIFGPEVVDTQYIDPVNFPNTYTQTRTQKITRNFAMGFGYNLAPEGEAQPAIIKRIWLDGVLFFQNGEYEPLNFDTNTLHNIPAGINVGGGGTGTALQPYIPGQLGSTTTYTTLNKKYQNLKFRFYGGTEEQTPDSAIAADKGDLAPSFRGMIYIVFEGVQVGYKMVRNAEGYDFESGVDNDDQHIDALTFPTVTVEFSDGESAEIERQPFVMSDESWDSSLKGSFVVDWERRIAKSVTLLRSPGDRLLTFDVDSKAQLSGVPISGSSGGEPHGTPGGWYPGTVQGDWFVWDKENDFLFFSHQTANSTSVIGINAVTGAVSGTFGAASSAIYPLDANGDNAYDTHLPAVSTTVQRVGDLSYMNSGGTRIPVICTGSVTIGVYAAPGGTLPSEIPWGAFYSVSDGASFFPTGDVCAIPLKGGDYQDACFLVSENKTSGVYLVALYVSYRNGAAVFTGRKVVYQKPPGWEINNIFLDADGQVCVFAKEGVNPPTFTKLRVRYDNSPELGSAPGWRGQFPHINGTVDLGGGPVTQPIFEDIPLGSLTSINKIKIKNSDLSFNTLQHGDRIIDLGTGSVTQLGYLGAQIPNDDRSFWDSAEDTIYSAGGFGDDGMYYVPLGFSFNAQEGALKNYLRWLALNAGYTVDQLNIDTGLNDGIIGALLTATVDSTTLFQQMSELYDFTFFESGGQLKFVRSARNPVKSTGLLTASDNPAPGDTVTLGVAVYTFRAALTAPFDVLIGADAQTSLTNLAAAINGDDGEGTVYGSGTTQNTKAFANVASASTMLATARQGGLGGNAIASTKTSSVLGWSSTSLSGGLEPPPPLETLTVHELAPLQEGGAGDNEVVITTLSSPSLAPSSAKLTYMDVNLSYQTSSQSYTPDTQGATLLGSAQRSYVMPFIMTAAEAYLRVSRVALKSGEQNTMQEFRLPWRYSLFEPSDVVSITLGRYQYSIRMDEVTFNGDYSLSCAGYNYAFRDDVYVSPQQTIGSIPQTVPGPGDAMPVVMDSPLLDPLFATFGSEVPIFTGVRTYGQAGWTSTNLSFGPDGSSMLAPLYTATVDTKWGVVQGILPDAPLPFMTDYSYDIQVVLRSIKADQLASITYEDFVAGKNCVAIGVEGQWEYVFFREIEVLSPTVVKLKGLLRGRRGTDVHMASHQAGDVVLFLRSGGIDLGAPLSAQSFDVSDLGDAYRWLASGNPARRAPAAVTVTLEGEALKPFTVTGLKANLVVGDDIDLSWVRRDRLGARDQVTDALPLSETDEAYDLEILAGTSVVRTLTDLTSPAYTYDAADQVTDGFTTPLSTIKVRVYQKGATGRGFMKEQVINVE